MKHAVWMISMALVMAGCSDQSDGTGLSDTDLGPDYVQKSGLLHGYACQLNNECKYGTCYDSPNVTAGEMKFCTKDCTQQQNGTCAADNTDTVTFTCIRWGTYHPEEHLRGFCVPTCQTVADCQAIDSRYNACANPGTGVYKVCMIKK